MHAAACTARYAMKEMRPTPSCPQVAGLIQVTGTQSRGAIQQSWFGLTPITVLALDCLGEQCRQESAGLTGENLEGKTPGGLVPGARAMRGA